MNDERGEGCVHVRSVIAVLEHNFWSSWRTSRSSTVTSPSSATSSSATTTTTATATATATGMLWCWAWFATLCIVLFSCNTACTARTTTTTCCRTVSACSLHFEYWKTTVLESKIGLKLGKIDWFQAPESGGDASLISDSSRNPVMQLKFPFCSQFFGFQSVATLDWQDKMLLQDIKCWIYASFLVDMLDKMLTKLGFFIGLCNKQELWTLPERELIWRLSHTFFE